MGGESDRQVRGKRLFEDFKSGHRTRPMVLRQDIGVYFFEKPGTPKVRLGVEDWADLARCRCLVALREVVVSAIPRGSGPGLRA
jgi:hypothetical protein